MNHGRPKIVVTNPVERGWLDVLEPHAELYVNAGPHPWPRRDLIKYSRDAFGLIAFMTDSVDEDFLRDCPDLRIVACALKGYDNFDVDACTRRGVWLTIVPDLLVAATADLAMALLLGLARNLLQADRFVRLGRHEGWRPMFFGRGLSGATVGLIGMGALGWAIAERLRGFDCRTRYYDTSPLLRDDERKLELSYVQLDSLIAGSDVIILALPLSKDTLHLIDGRRLSLIKPGCLLINPARGSLVDEEAVADALEAGALGGYAADVFAFEDRAFVPHSGPIPDRLISNDRQTLFTPHLGSAIATVRQAITTEAALNVLDTIQGRRPRGAINDVSDRQEGGT
ncbi:MAG: hydroxyacid dehydrogenase [Rhodobacteraceae bacterium]|nr:hydroxyacid dehydrogenase [Paracoccaceae bacterium]